MMERVSITPNDRYMVYLPLSHVGTVFGSFVYSIAMGASLYITNDFKEMAENLNLIRLTVLYGVPRVFEKLWETVSSDGRVIRAITLSNFLRKLGIDIRKRLFARLYKGVGGALRLAYSGGAKLNDLLIRNFRDMGLIILQAYGMTESSAIISCDSIKDYRLCSVGKVLSNQVCKIIDQNENGIGKICVKGGNVAECAVSDDGYLHTGDLGYLDKDGYLFVVGRKKRLIKMSNAKNVYPDELEELLTLNREISHARVYENCGHIATEVVSNYGEEIVNSLIENINEELPYYMQIRYVTVVDTQKLKLDCMIWTFSGSFTAHNKGSNL